MPNSACAIVLLYFFVHLFKRKLSESNKGN